MLAAVGAGVYSTAARAADAWLSVTDRTEPDPSRFEAYRAAHVRYRKLYPRLKKQFLETAGQS